MRCSGVTSGSAGPLGCIKSGWLQQQLQRACAWCPNGFLCPTEFRSLPASGTANKLAGQDSEPEQADCTWRPAAMAIIRELALKFGLVEAGAPSGSSMAWQRHCGTACTGHQSCCSCRQS